MSRIKEIRERLGMTQAEFGDGIGCTQGNVGHLERGQVLMVDRAERVIELAAKRGLRLTLDQVYGRAPLPANRPQQRGAHKPKRSNGNEHPQATRHIVTTDYTGPDRRKVGCRG